MRRARAHFLNALVKPLIVELLPVLRREEVSTAIRPLSGLGRHVTVAEAHGREARTAGLWGEKLCLRVFGRRGRLGSGAAPLDLHARQKGSVLSGCVVEVIAVYQTSHTLHATREFLARNIDATQTQTLPDAKATAIRKCWIRSRFVV